MVNLYGSIGFCLLNNIDSKPNNILVLSDMHSQLSYCSDYKTVSEWLIDKIKNNNILLEEVPRDNVELKELFENSDHTKELKNLFLKNADIIHAIDIRIYLVPFSWEIFKFTEKIDIVFSDYLKLIEDFYNFKHDKFKMLLNKIYSKKYIYSNNLKFQFLVIKNKYLDYLTNNNQNLKKNIFDLYENKIKILEEINDHLNNIMEFFIICKIFYLKENKKNIIIHTGLYHSQNIIFWLTEIYKYNIKFKIGFNNIDDLNNKKIENGCISLPEDINNIFN
jgi:hypothetical protein